MTVSAQKVPALTVRGLSMTFDVSVPWLNRVIERKPRQFVQAVNGIAGEEIKETLLHHAPCAAAAFLGRLEDEMHRS